MVRTLKASESKVSASIKGYALMRRDLFLERTNAGMAKRKNKKTGEDYNIKLCGIGHSDFTGHVTIRGLAFALYVETKSSSGKQTPEQEEFQRRREAEGAIYILTTNVNDFQEKLDAKIAEIKSRVLVLYPTPIV